MPKTIISGIPHCAINVPPASVKSFGEGWNYFNFTDFKVNCLKPAVENKFCSMGASRGKLMVDAGRAGVLRQNGLRNMALAM